MQPITDDNAERGRNFTPTEHDLADAALSVKARHDLSFQYERKVEKPVFCIDWVEPEFALDSADQIKEDEFDIAHGITTPAGIMRRKDPTRFKTHEKAVEQWKKNVAEIQSVGGGLFGADPGSMAGEFDEDGQGIAGMPPVPPGGEPIDLGGIGTEIAHASCPACAGRNGNGHQGAHTAAGTPGMLDALRRQGQLS